MNTIPAAIDVSNREDIRRAATFDLGPILYKLVTPEPGQEPKMTREEAEQAILEYRKFLILMLLYPERSLVPTQVIDRVWHGHILDTEKYRMDCEFIFGRFVDHYPYFGMRSKEDRLALEKDAAATKALYSQVFGDVWLGGAASPCSPPLCEKPDCRKPASDATGVVSRPSIPAPVLVLAQMTEVKNGNGKSL